MVRSLFWTRRWFRITRERLPTPENEADGRFSFLSSALVLGLTALAYALYPREQVQSLADIAGGFISGFSVDAWVQTAAVVAVAYLLLGWSLRVRWRQLSRPLLHVLHPMTLTLAAFAAVYPLQLSVRRQMQVLAHDTGNTIPAPLAQHLALTMALWLVAGWFMSWSFFGFAHAAYRVSKYHMFAPGLHPALAPLMELALAARALTAAVEGKALIFNLPPIPSRLIAAAPPLLATAYFAYRATDVQRALLHQQGSGLRRQISRLGREVSNSRRPVRTRLRSLWDFRRTQTGRLGLGLLTVAVGTLVSASVGAV